MNWPEVFEQSLPYAAFLDRYAKPDHRARWDAMHGRVRLTGAQKALLGGFVRRMPVVVLNGAWCGDCSAQCPIFERIAEAAPQVVVRYIDRDEHADAQAALQVNGGNRVPVAVFLVKVVPPIVAVPPETARPPPDAPPWYARAPPGSGKAGPIGPLVAWLPVRVVPVMTSLPAPLLIAPPLAPPEELEPG